MAFAGGTIVNPTLPYNCPVPGGMQNGKMIIIQGTCRNHQNSFSVNLALTPEMEPLGNVALHFNPRFNENCIVRNHMQGSWGAEERSGGMPLKRGTPFEVIIMADSQHYKISINGQHFCNFRHRTAKESVQYLVIVGEVAISYIKFEGGMPSGIQPPQYQPPQPQYQPPPPQYQPSPAGFMAPGPPGHTPNPFRSPAPAYPGGSQPVYNPPVPYTANIPGGLFPGRMIYISGVPHAGASRFNVNLMCGPSEQGDIAFHFDARFSFGGAYNQTVRTHKTAGVWGAEEKSQSYFPFVPNSNFDMIVLIEAASIKVAVNNQHFCEFNHRIQPIGRVDFLMIQGDVRLTSVRVQ